MDDHRFRVLVADHDTLMRISLAAALDRAGYVVTTAADGDEALALLDADTPDVLLMDDRLGSGPSGYEVLRVLRGRPEGRDVVVLLTISEHQPEARVRALEAGATDYVVVPAPLPELLARIGAHLERRDQWLVTLDERLAARRRLSQALADLSPHDEGLEPLLQPLFTEHLDAVDVRLHHASHVLADGGRTPTVAPASDAAATIVRLPLRVDGRTTSLLEVVVPGDGAAALATLTDLGPQLATLICTRGADASVVRLRTALQDRMRADGMCAVYQPIVDLRTGAVVGHEALTRFADGHRPDVVFAQARTCGVDRELELSALGLQLRGADALPKGTWLSVNLSADTFVNGDLTALHGSRRDVVIELTEHDHVEDYSLLRDRRRALAPLRLAVDDVGSGYASLRHLLELRPDFTKLDRDWIRGIADDPVRQALVGCVVGAARVSGALVVGEGVETPAEARTLVDLGVHLGQGWLFGRPAPAAGRRSLVSA